MTISMEMVCMAKIPTKKKTIRTLGFSSRLPCHIINLLVVKISHKVCRNDHVTTMQCLTHKLCSELQTKDQQLKRLTDYNNILKVKTKPKHVISKTI